MESVHATSVVFCGRGLLLRGPSGAGKTDLALRLMEAGGMLIADDYTALSLRDGRVWMMPPETIKGMIEIRGYGPVRVPHGGGAILDMILDCLPVAPPRLPEKRVETLLGVSVPVLQMAALEASAVAKLRLILQYPPVA